METRILTGSDIRRIALHIGLDQLMDAMIERLHAALLEFRPSKTVVFPRQGFTYAQPSAGLLEWMPCMDGDARATVKVVGYHPSNPPQRQLPTILATVSEYDTRTGHLTCIMDGTLLTALRTAAASAIATRILAKPESTLVGLIGAGAQAITQLHAISRVRPIRDVLVYDVRQDLMASFPVRASSIPGGIIVQRASLEEIVRTADIICTATSIGPGEGPLFDAIEPQPWAHFNAVGSDFRGKVELPASLLRRSFVCPDSREQAKREGECQQLDPGEIGPSLDELVQQASDYRSMQERLTVFDSTGWALEDHVAMRLFTDLADQLGLGSFVAIEQIPADAVNPYAFLQDADGVVAATPGGSVART